MEKPKVLIVEDDDAIRTQLKYALREEYMLGFAGDRADALAQVQSMAPKVVTLDLGLPPQPDTAEEGLKALEAILTTAPGTKVLVVTGNEDRENAVRAVALGAWDYYLKPIDVEELRLVLRRAVRLGELEGEADRWVNEREAQVRFEEIVGNTPVMGEIFEVIRRVAKSDATVLVQGESGTGKELIARAIHRRSRRREAPLVAINCGAIPDSLLESELFGHERGAFTGAHVQRKGRFELAEDGTLFLDEIAELGLMLQVKFLRFLQEHTIERIGGRESIQLDLRVIAATNKDLKEEMAQGRFREDLYYRLSVVTIKVPPLRDRGEDVVVLAATFLRRAASAPHRRLRFSEDALRSLRAYAWPGNIRELENKVSRAVIMARGRLIEPADLDLPASGPERSPSLRELREQAEREALVGALSRHHGNISQAARELAVSRPTLHGLLDKHGVNAREFR